MNARQRLAATWFVSLVVVLMSASGCALAGDSDSSDPGDDFAVTDDPLTLKRDDVLENLGSCFDRAKFDAMRLDQWRTTARTSSNNTNAIARWNENPNNCTGCNNATCATCHSDASIAFYDVAGNPLFPADATFEATKEKTHITSYFGWTTKGRASASHAINKKADATKKSAAYTHPLFVLTAAQQTALDAFVADAVNRYNTGKCGH